MLCCPVFPLLCCDMLFLLPLQVQALMAELAKGFNVPPLPFTGEHFFAIGGGGARADVGAASHSRWSARSASHKLMSCHV